MEHRVSNAAFSLRDPAQEAVMHKISSALPSFLFGIVAAGVLFVGLAALFLERMDPFWGWVVAAGAVTFIYYGVDKAHSQVAGRRIPEWTLHGLALAGGVAGGWLGIFFFRHKTLHRDFRYVLALASLLWLWLLWQG